MLSSNDGKRCDTFFKIHCGVGTDRGGVIVQKKYSLLIWILTPLLPTLFPLHSLFRDTAMRVQIAGKASTGEQQQKPVKWNILHYHQGSPPPHRLKSSALPSRLRLCAATACAPLRESESAHTCKCASTCIHRRQSLRRNKKMQKKKKKEEETRFGMSLRVFYSYIILFCAPPHHHPHHSSSPLPPSSMVGNKETGATIRVWCDTLLRPLFCMTPANMQAHLSRALKPSLILWRPKHSNFFQQTSSQLALDCQWGSPNS